MVRYLDFKNILKTKFETDCCKLCFYSILNLMKELRTIGCVLVFSLIFSCKTGHNLKSKNQALEVMRESENQEGRKSDKQETASKPFAKRLEWTGAELKDKNYSIWGSSPIIGDDGKIHVFAARWPELNVDPAWRKSSEVAHYVADSPEGPFTFSDVAVEGSGVEGAWDRYAAHNPEVKKIGDYYAIAYVANSDYRQPPHPSNQKIGLVYSKSLYGPWKRAGKNGMIVEVSENPDHWTYGSGLGVDNPCLNEIDGKPIVYFKARLMQENVNIKAKYAYAKAESIEGPYIMSEPITDNDSYLEDATTFTWNNKYYMLTTDNHGTVTGVAGGGILWSSHDWKKFDVKDIELAYDLIPKYNKDYDESNVTKIYGRWPKFERPKVLLQDGIPTYFFAPSGWNIDGGYRSVCYILKINHAN